jgi:hypothetical protein
MNALLSSPDWVIEEKVEDVGGGMLQNAGFSPADRS